AEAHKENRGTARVCPGLHHDYGFDVRRTTVGLCRMLLPSPMMNQPGQPPCDTTRYKSCAPAGRGKMRTVSKDSPGRIKSVIGRPGPASDWRYSRPAASMR